MPGLDQSTREAAETVARRSYGKLVAYLAARTRDVAAAEDALAEAFTAALADWPQNGVPRSPEAWLLTVARRKLVDVARHRTTAAEASGELRLIADELEAIADDPNDIPDERLKLMFACAHPAIEQSIRAPLMLQTVLGFSAETIASAFLVAPAAMGQRLARAKSRIRDAGIPFRIPDRADLAEREDAVLEAIYAAFAEGWSDPAGTETRRRNLAEEGLWLGRLIVSLMPEDAEAQGLLALMLYAEARRAARRSSCGAYVPLAEQNPEDWNLAMIDEAERLLTQASVRATVGRYQLEAAVQSAHVVRRQTGRADWPAIERLYDALYQLTGSPVVALNRALAIAETRGPSEGLAALEALQDERLADYQPYWAAVAELRGRLGDAERARAAYQRAIGLEADPAVREFLLKRQAALGAENHT